MVIKLVGEDGTTNISKLLHLKVQSFVADESGPGEFSKVGKNLIFTAPEMEFGDEYEKSVTISYLNKNGKLLTKEFTFIVADTDGVKSTLMGDDGPNTVINPSGKSQLIYGLGGDDVIKPGNGNDKIYAGDGNDEIYGYGGDDKIAGEGGNDTINAGEGTNFVNAGAGDDLIFIRGTNDVVVGGDGIDSFGLYDLAGVTVIKDFVSGTDKLYYEGNRFNESEFAGIATAAATGTILKFDADTSVLLEGLFL